MPYRLQQLVHIERDVCFFIISISHIDLQKLHVIPCNQYYSLNQVFSQMFQFDTCSEVYRPDGHDKRLYGGGIVELEGTVVWGHGKHIYRWNREEKWETLSAGVEVGARLAMCGGRLVAVGGLLQQKCEDGPGVCSKKVMAWREEKWTLMTEMLVGCELPCVVSVGENGLVVMGGWGDHGRRISYVQVFDGMTKTWYFGLPLPEPCGAISAVVNGDLVYLLGGWGMDTAVWCANITDLVSP